ncbi:nucleotidyltransferase family protein [Prevotella sp. MA2016]|uniref:nucleotidyltransferase family protein n=1 Tax=Prevotella sp. MA2016 TaxID=1408310 RepID=UPI00048B3925|nr:nucleotidyltransferase family protein [Prevotella sp. MA2016]
MLSENIQKFFLILQLAVGKQIKPPLHLSENGWHSIYDIASKQSLVGVMIEGIQRLSEIDTSQKPPLTLLYEWIGIAEHIKRQNKLMDERSEMLTRILKSWGYDSCILKGQGVARLYPKPELRQSGDIDIWVNGFRNDVVKVLKKQYIGLSDIDYVNCHVGFFTDAEVEAHFKPTWMYNPFTDRKLQKWIEANKAAQMANYDKEVKFCYPTIEFNLVFSLIHIYRHVFQEGIGLRQLMDYYYILIHSSNEERVKAFATLCSFGMKKFIGAVMYVLRIVFDIDETLLLCEPNNREGKFLLDEILRGGNFGKYDDRNEAIPVDNKIQHGLFNIKRNLRYLKHYPSEVLWMPLWRVWHWSWRMSKGYL